MSIRKALGAVKDQTSIDIAKVSSNIAPDLDVAIVKATSHADEPADEKYLREILSLTSYSRGYVGACVATISRCLSKTCDWIVALKSLMLIHRLLSEGDSSFLHEILQATRRGTRFLHMSDFRDEAHSTSWEHSAFVHTNALDRAIDVHDPLLVCLEDRQIEERYNRIHRKARLLSHLFEDLLYNDKDLLPSSASLCSK